MKGCRSTGWVAKGNGLSTGKLKSGVSASLFCGWVVILVEEEKILFRKGSNRSLGYGPRRLGLVGPNPETADSKSVGV